MAAIHGVTLANLRDLFVTTISKAPGPAGAKPIWSRVMVSLGITEPAGLTVLI